jgi:hypothetical protein
VAGESDAVGTAGAIKPIGASIGAERELGVLVDGAPGDDGAATGALATEGARIGSPCGGGSDGEFGAGGTKKAKGDFDWIGATTGAPPRDAGASPIGTVAIAGAPAGIATGGEVGVKDDGASSTGAAGCIGDMFGALFGERIGEEKGTPIHGDVVPSLGKRTAGELGKDPEGATFTGDIGSNGLASKGISTGAPPDETMGPFGVGSVITGDDSTGPACGTPAGAVAGGNDTPEGAVVPTGEPLESVVTDDDKGALVVVPVVAGRLVSALALVSCPEGAGMGAEVADGAVTGDIVAIDVADTGLSDNTGADTLATVPLVVSVGVVAGPLVAAAMGATAAAVEVIGAVGAPGSTAAGAAEFVPSSVGAKGAVADTGVGAASESSALGDVAGL